MKNSNPRVGIIGCGAATEKLHLPALATLQVTPALLVDPNVPRTKQLAEKFAEKFKVPRVAETYESSVKDIDAAIVAVPHHLHARVSSDLLRRGIHVLVEKPLAPTEAECREVVAAAQASGAVLAVGLMRRFLNRIQWVKSALDAGVLGTVESFDIREGFVYKWPVASGFFFRKETAGGGVLADTGAHTMDLVLWWFGRPASVEYRDDSQGGVEADCIAHLTYANGVAGVVELSRTRDLRNTAIIRGQRGEIEVRLHDTTLDTLSSRPSELLQHQHRGVSGHRLPPQRFRPLFVLQIEDWLRAIGTGAEPLVGGVEASRSVALIEECYRQRQPLELPWDRPFAHQTADLAVRSQ